MGVGKLLSLIIKTTKNMRLAIVVLFAALLSGTDLKSQSSCSQFFPFEEFESMTYAHYDRRDRLESRHQWQVMELKRDGDRIEAKVALTVREPNGDILMTNSFTAYCEEDTYYIGLEGVHMNEFSDAFGEGMEMEISGTHLSIPDNISVGDRLPDAQMEARITSPIPMTIHMEITDRTVDEKSEITTPAGTFEAYKISQENMVRAVIRSRSQSVEYYSPRYGMIRSETMNRRGRLQAYTQLEEVVEK